MAELERTREIAMDRQRDRAEAQYRLRHVIKKVEQWEALLAGASADRREEPKAKVEVEAEDAQDVPDVEGGHAAVAQAAALVAQRKQPLAPRNLRAMVLPDGSILLAWDRPEVLA
jgi:hypothetical protein